MTEGARILLIGSGETAPTMIGVQRRFLTGRERAVSIDTTFAFQTNADDLVAKTLKYFQQAVGADVGALTWRETMDDAARERAVATLHAADWVFAGPGSPTYALRQWRGTALPGAWAELVRRGGTLVAGSAAACTIGSHCVPVYEIYKAGHDPYWEPGLDLLDELAGLSLAVIPHFDNAEGGVYDTRYCYLGASRLVVLEEALPEGHGFLGVDEHTAVSLDLPADTLEVLGTGTATLGRGGHRWVIPAGETHPIAAVRNWLAGVELVEAEVADGGTAHEAPVGPLPDRLEQQSLATETRTWLATFDSAHRAHDVDGCVSATLGLHTSILNWSTDSLQSSDNDRAQAALRSMIVRLAELVQAHEPFVAALLDLRAGVRAKRDFALSDQIRDALLAHGVQVKDTAAGQEWEAAQA